MSPMCCTLRSAHLSKTIIYSGEAIHKEKLVHVIGYQNRASNLSRGPNAMILPFPSTAPMGKENCLEASNMKWLMRELASPIETAAMLKTMSKSSSRGIRYGASSISVFQSGEYTVVLADDARDIPTALHKVPVNKRPAVNEEIFEFYAKWYPDWPVAICCFESNEYKTQDPLIWWYEPEDKTRLFAPALDAHNGKAPKLDSKVITDHVVVFGSTIEPRGASVKLREDVPSHLVDFIPPKVVGREFNTDMINGDFEVKIESLHSISNTSKSPDIKVDRIQPPGSLS